MLVLVGIALLIGDQPLLLLVLMSYWRRRKIGGPTILSDMGILHQ